MQSDNNDLTIFIVAQNLYIQFENDDFYNLLIMKSILRLIFYSQGLLFSKYIECKLKLLQQQYSTPYVFEHRDTFRRKIGNGILL